MNQFKKYLGNSINVNKGLNEEFLPVIYLEIMQEFLAHKFPFVNQELFVSNLNSFFAHFLSYKRVQIDLLGRRVAPNYYTIIFSPSGTGKDAIFSTIQRELAPKFEEIFDRDTKKKYAQKKSSLESLYINDEEVSGKALEKRIKQELRVFPKKTINMATKEGYVHNRESFQFYNFGASMLVMSEFTDYLLSGSIEEKGLLSNLVKSWEDGEDDYIKLKLTDDNLKVKDVPSNLLAFSSISGLKGTKQYDVFLKNLSRGLARRSFILVPSVPILEVGENEDVAKIAKKYSDRVKKANERIPYFRGRIEDILNYEVGDGILSLSKSAEEIYSVYEIYCRTQAGELPRATLEGVRAEVQNRHSKMIRLAGVYAKVEDITTDTIEDHHILSAIHWTEYVGKYLQQIVQDGPEYDMLDLLKPGIEVKLTELYDIAAPGERNRSRRKEIFADMLPMVEALLKHKGLSLEIKPDPGDARYKVAKAVPGTPLDPTHDEFF